MIQKMRVLERIVDTGIIAVVRADSPEQALKVAEAVMQGGVDIIEITLTVPGAIKVIEELKANFEKEEILLGAGTVLDPETARLAILAGAEYIVGPNLNHDVIKLCNRYQKICMPGCVTITEVISALESGADVIKLFPGNVFGPSMVKAIKGPLPQAEFIPTGGVSLENVQEWIKNGCIAVGVGGDLTGAVKKGDYRAVTETAKQFIAKIQEARDKQSG